MFFFLKLIWRLSAHPSSLWGGLGETIIVTRRDSMGCKRHGSRFMGLEKIAEV